MFGQLVVGPAGSGKTTFCNGMLHYLTLQGRKAAVLNLDPANDGLPYECAVNVADLITLDAVQADAGLGPNGGLVYAMEYVAANLDWLQERLKPLLEAGTYLIVDCPGQVELFNVHDALFKVVSFLTDKLHIRLTAVHLVDSHLCAEPGKYLSAVLLSLTTMLHLGLPHVNVLSKIDLLPTYGPLAFGLDFYAGHGDMARLAAAINSQPGMGRYAKLTRSLCELCEDYKLVSFTTLDVQDEASMRRLVATVDKSNGYVFTAMERKAKAAGGPVSMPQMYAASPMDWAAALQDVQERYLDRAEERDDDDG